MITRKEALTEKEIWRIVKALGPYRNHEDKIRQEWFWVVVLLMHKGCRALEVVQLLKTDVRLVEEMMCLDVVWQGERRHVKNRDSMRKVPIHSNVLKSGFLEWHDQQTGPRLFSSLHPYGPMKASKWSSVLLEDLGIKRREVTLHSLRHAFAVPLEKARVHPSLSYRLPVGCMQPRT